MRKVIDLCLDLPMDPETVTQTLRTMCLDPGYSGYKHTYAPQIARDIGLDIHRLDAIAAETNRSRNEVIGLLLDFALEHAAVEKRSPEDGQGGEG